MCSRNPILHPNRISSNIIRNDVGGGRQRHQLGWAYMSQGFVRGISDPHSAVGFLINIQTICRSTPQAPSDEMARFDQILRV